FFSSRRRHTRSKRDWSSDVCSSDLGVVAGVSSIGVYVAARAFDIPVPADRLALATALVLPVVFALGAIGHALVGWRPRVAVALRSEERRVGKGWWGRVVGFHVM